MTRRVAKKFCLILPALALAIFCVLHAATAWADDQVQTEAINPVSITDPADDEDMLFYAFLKNDPSQAPPFIAAFGNNDFVKNFLLSTNREDAQFRPMLQWRRWAEQKQPFLRSWLFCLFTSWSFWILIPKKLQAAEQVCRKEFWTCQLNGFALAGICLILARAAFLTHLGWPLGILLIALFQLGLLLGLTIIVSLSGHRIALLLRLGKWPLFSSRRGLCRFGELFLGTLLCAAILQIPVLGDLPRIGTRLVALFCLLGLGSLYKCLKGQEST